MRTKIKNFVGIVRILKGAGPFEISPVALAVFKPAYQKITLTLPDA